MDKGKNVLHPMDRSRHCLNLNVHEVINDNYEVTPLIVWYFISLRQDYSQLYTSFLYFWLFFLYFILSLLTITYCSCWTHPCLSHGQQEHFLAIQLALFAMLRPWQLQYGALHRELQIRFIHTLTQLLRIQVLSR